MPNSPRRGSRKSAAFTLVELAIVLVTLALLTGGILTGRSLIRANEMRTIMGEFSSFAIAIQNFSEKYTAVPGDMKTATNFWGKDNVNCPLQTGTINANGTCNGNGNGQAEQAAVVGGTAETMQFWRQLALAGFISGNYTGLSGAAGINQALIGVNVPKSRKSNTGWSTVYRGNAWGNADMFLLSYGNVLQYGAGSSTGTTYMPALTPEEAWNIDKKFDDGSPAKGDVIGNFWNNLCANGTSNTDSNATYRVTDSNVLCSIQVRNAY